MPTGIPNKRRLYYEVVHEVDLAWYAPDQRVERWPRRGQRDVQPMSVMHSMRLGPSPGYTARGNALPPHYIVTDRPVGNTYTEEVMKVVSRPIQDSAQRTMRPKYSKIKLRLLDKDEIIGSGMEPSDRVLSCLI